MSVTTLNGHQIHVNDEGFLSRPHRVGRDIGAALAAQIGLALTDEHWKAIHFLRQDFQEAGETPTPRRVSTVGAIPIKTLFTLFPQKPTKKMAYVAGLPKPVGCV